LFARIERWTSTTDRWSRGTERKAKVRVAAHLGDTLTAEFEGPFVAVPPFDY